MDLLPIIGREPELKQFADVLARRQPALIMVGAEAGMGKTRFLIELEARAEAAGWRVAYRENDEELSVKLGSTRETFSERLRKLLELPDPEQAAYSGGAREAVRRIPPRLEQMGTRAPSLLPRTLSDLRDRDPTVDLGSGAESDSEGRGRIMTLPEQIRTRAPVLILIDGYQPKKGFGAWFRRALLEPLRQGPDPAVVVIADLPGITETLASDLSPDQMIRLGPLAIEDVERFLRSICEEIEPPLDDEELRRYAEAACSDPEVLIGLARVLPLAGEAEVAP